MIVVVQETTKTELIVYAILMIIIGILFIWDKDTAMDIGFIIAGIFLMIAGLLPIIVTKDINVLSFIFVVLGLLLIMVPHFFTDVAVVVLGIIAIIVGILYVLSASKVKQQAPMIVMMLVGILIVVAGISMILDMDIAFQLFGALLAIAGAVNLIAALKIQTN